MAIGTPLYIATADNDLNNAGTGDQVLWSYTVPGGTLAVDDMLVFDCGGYLRNSSGGSVNYTFKIKFGGVTLLTGTAIAAATNATTTNVREWFLRGELYVPTTTSQRANADLHVGEANAENWPATGGTGFREVGYSALGTADVANAQTFEVTVAMSVSATTVRSVLGTACLQHVS